MKKNKTLFVVTGEKSGDFFASRLIKNLKKFDKTLKVVGLGGVDMENAGCEILYNTSDLGVIGFSGIFKKYFFFRNLFGRTLSLIRISKPDAVLFVDYSGLNLRLAPFVKSMNISTIYYIPPKIWAWNRERIRSIKKYIDKIFVIYKFEEQFYKDSGYEPVFFRGHPFLDEKVYQGISPRKRIPERKIIALLPGSRIEEIQRHLPVLLKMRSSLPPDYEYVLVAGTDLALHHINRILKKKKVSLEIYREMDKVLKIASLAVVASGTAVMECALVGVPSVVIYKIGFLTGFLLKKLLKIRYVSLVNILAEKKILSEFLQRRCRPHLIAKEVQRLLDSPESYVEMSQDLLNLTKKLQPSGSSASIARTILNDL